MAEPLKYIYNKIFFETFISEIEKVHSQFDKKSFLKQIFDKEWDTLELKARMSRVAFVLESLVPKPYITQIEIILKLIENLKSKDVEMNFEYMFLPDFVEQFGMNEYEVSIDAIERITQYTSCEFVIRSFIIKYPQQTIDKLIVWSKHEDYRVRRLASEGCRPRLPWAMALPLFKKNPKPILSILENLKNDPTDFVYRSVANNLNDISKDNPEITLDLCEKWIGKTKNTDWVVRHACRGLLKQGNTRALQLFGYSPIDGLVMNDLLIEQDKVKNGGEVIFSFILKNSTKETKKLRIEYNVYFMKANGKLAPKIFKISELKLSSNTSTSFSKKHSFKFISTRKYYVGNHKIEILINGVEMGDKKFELVL